MITLTNFPSPEADYGVLPLMAVAFLTPMPLYAILVVTKIVAWRKRIAGKQENEKKQEYELAATSDQV